MADFTWVGGNLANPSSWSPQPLPPALPVEPGPGDSVTIGGGGVLAGSLGVLTADITGGTFSLQGAITAVGLTFSAVTGSGASNLTLQSGGSLNSSGGGEQLGGLAAATITQLGGANTASATVNIDTGSSYDLQGGTFSTANYVVLGVAAGNAGAFTQSGGTATVVGIVANSGSLALDAGILNVGTGNVYVGDIAGTGASFTQTGGTFAVGSDMAVGQNGTGTYTLSGGVLSSVADYIGQNATGSFVQTGGTHTVSDRIVLGINVTGPSAPAGTGSYTLGGTGTLTVQTIFIGSDPGCTGTFLFNQNAPDTAALTISGTGGFPGLIVGGQGTGTFTHGGGSLSTTLVLGRTTTGIGTYNFLGGTLVSTDEEIGSVGAGTFIQSSGTNNAQGTGLVLGSTAAATGTYDLNGGVLTAVSETIGNLGTGTVTQTGGSNTTTGTLVVANGTNSTGSYGLTTGTLIAASETIGSQGSGTFTAQGGTNTIGGSLTLAAAIGSSGTYTLSGGTVSATGETIGGQGSGTFTATGGSNIAKGSLVVGGSASATGVYTLGGNSTLQSQGDVTIGNLASATGTFNFNTAAVDAATFAIGSNTLHVGGAGTGTFTQGGGLIAGAVDVGAQAGGSGTYQLNGGTISATNETIGNAGTGTLIEAGGDNTITTGDLIVGNANGGDGTYQVNQGALTVQTGSITLGAQASSTGTLVFDTGPADTGEITIGSQQLVVGDGGSGVFTQGGGTLQADLLVASQIGSTGSVELDAGTIISAGQTIGDAGTGNFNQKGGTNIITTSGLLVGNATPVGLPPIVKGGSNYTLAATADLEIQAGDLVLGGTGNSSGNFNFNYAPGDAATLNIANGVVQVGFHGSGKFNQAAGTLNAKVIVGSQVGSQGTYELAGGTVSSLGQVVGNNGTGTFKQDDGTNTINGNGDLLIGALSLGFGTYKLNGGQLSAGSELLGNDGLGSFVQKGGSNLIGNGTLALGVQADGSGAYELDTGTLTPSVLNVGTGSTSGQEIVGDLGTGNFVQKGGTNTLSGGNLSVGVANTGTYTMSGGTLTVQGNTPQPDVDINLGAQSGGKGILTVGTGTVIAPKLLIGGFGTGIVNATTSGIIMIGSLVQMAAGSTLTAQKGSVLIGSGLSAAPGTVQVGNNASLIGAGLLDTTLDIATQGTATVSGGLLDVTGAIIGAGTITIGAGSMLEIGGANTAVVAFADGTGTLQLDTPSAFATPIGNFVSGDEIVVTGTAVKSVTLDPTEHSLTLFGTNAANLGTVTFAQAVTAPEVVALPSGAVGAAACFLVGTRIDTAHGPVAVEALRPGDRVTALLARRAPAVRWIGRRGIDCTRHPNPRQVWPVRILAHAFGPDQPRRDLYLSPDHAVYVTGVLVPVKLLINHRTIVQTPMDRVTYYHVELPEHDVLLAEGLPAESYLDTGDRSKFENGGGPMVLHPDFSILIWEGDACAPLVVTGTELAAIRRRLALRAATASWFGIACA